MCFDRRIVLFVVVNNVVIDCKDGDFFNTSDNILSKKDIFRCFFQFLYDFFADLHNNFVFLHYQF